jgi:hypothetical protein
MKEIKAGDKIVFTNSNNQKVTDIVTKVEGRNLHTKNNGSVDRTHISKVNGGIWLPNLLNRSTNPKVMWLLDYWLNKEERKDDQEILSENIEELVNEIDRIKTSIIERESKNIFVSLNILREHDARGVLKYTATESMSRLVDVLKEGKEKTPLDLKHVKFNSLKCDFLDKGVNEIPEFIKELQDFYDEYQKKD